MELLLSFTEHSSLIFVFFFTLTWVLILTTAYLYRKIRLHLICQAFVSRWKASCCKTVVVLRMCCKSHMPARSIQLCCVYSSAFLASLHLQLQKKIFTFVYHYYTHTRTHTEEHTGKRRGISNAAYYVQGECVIPTSWLSNHCA